MMRTLSIEFKIIIGIIFFTLLTTGLERYQLSENITTQFVNSKKAKNKLLLQTMLPVLSLNISLGLEEANKDYLHLIVGQNRDITFMKVTDENDRTLFIYPKNVQSKQDIPDGIKYCQNAIVDNLTNKIVGYIHVEFSNDEYEQMQKKNKQTTLNILIVVLILLSIFIFILKRELKHLKKLTNAVVAYDPKQNNFDLQKSNRTDEVGVIHNAIVDMVEKIASYTALMDEMNATLEEKIIERTKALQNANHKLEQMSMTDSLTKLANRRHFEVYIANTWEMAIRTQTHISLIMCDIDHFKNVNDTYGHIAGDEVLKNVARTLVKSLRRSTDLVARYGGEEFVIVLYDTELEGAVLLCTEIAENLKNPKNFTVNGIEITPFTMSFGVSSVVPSLDISYNNLLETSDEALYKAKESGRNCTVSLDFSSKIMSLY